MQQPRKSLMEKGLKARANRGPGRFPGGAPGCSGRVPGRPAALSRGADGVQMLVAVRRKIWPFEIAGELSVYSSTAFSARTSKAGPALSTLVSPSSLVT